MGIDNSVITGCEREDGGGREYRAEMNGNGKNNLKNFKN